MFFSALSKHAFLLCRVSDLKLDDLGSSGGCFRPISPRNDNPQMVVCMSATITPIASSRLDRSSNLHDGGAESVPHIPRRGCINGIADQRGVSRYGVAFSNGRLDKSNSHAPTRILSLSLTKTPLGAILCLVLSSPFTPQFTTMVHSYSATARSGRSIQPGSVCCIRSIKQRCRARTHARRIRLSHDNQTYVMLHEQPSSALQGGVSTMLAAPAV